MRKRSVFSKISARLKEIQLLFKLLSNPINHAVALLRLPYGNQES